MLLLRASELPEGKGWLTELKLDGFRAIAFKSSGKVHLGSTPRSQSRNGCFGLTITADRFTVSGTGTFAASKNGLQLDSRRAVRVELTA
jgi:hypothetical protein